MNSVFAVNIENITDNFKEIVPKFNYLDIQKVFKYRQKKDQYRKFVSILLTQFFIKKLFSLSDYELVYNSYGKPYIKEYPEKNFNISHSGCWVVGAVSDMPIGIDIECIKEMDSFKDIARRFFSSDEYEFLLKQPMEKSLQIFYEIWTKKESLIKAVGKGLSIPLDSFAVPFTVSGKVDYANSSWNVSLYDFSDTDYKLAIASNFCCTDFMPVKHLSVKELWESICLKK